MLATFHGKASLKKSNLNLSKDHWKTIILSDAKGYYAYLPAIFIYNDLNFGFFEEIEQKKYYNKNTFYDYRSKANRQVINRYFVGTALAEMPFFAVAHILSYFLGFEQDGYSNLYPILINIGALFYLMIGLVYLKRTLGLYKIEGWCQILTFGAAVFGTNLFYYSVSESGMSHVYSIAFISMFIYFSKQFFSSNSIKYIPTLALIMGIITLIRPINLVILASLPFISGSYSTFKQGIFTLFKNKLLLSLSVLLFGMLVSIQLIIYKISTGNFFVYSYQDVGFNFFEPHIIDILCRMRPSSDCRTT